MPEPESELDWESWAAEEYEPLGLQYAIASEAVLAEDWADETVDWDGWLEPPPRKTVTLKVRMIAGKQRPPRFPEEAPDE